MKNEQEKMTQMRSLLPDDLQVNLSDFALFLSVMNNKTAYQNVLSIIMDEPDIELTEVKVEQVVMNKSGKRAIRLDAWALDITNRQFDMEMQNDSSHENLPRRARFYQGVMDSPILKSGKKTKYRNLPATIIIFITQEDIFGRDCAKYTFSECCEELPDLRLEDGTKKIFLNMSSKNGSPELISLLQYMKETNITNPNIIKKDDRIIELDRIVQEVRSSEEWEAIEMNILEIGIENGKQQGKEQGIIAMILDNREENIPQHRIIQKLEKRFGVTKEEAENYIKKADLQK